MSTELLARGYEPHEVEKRLYAYWLENGLFAGAETDDRRPFSIVIPPPNVTGVLHMGHALNTTLQDIMCRYRRLRGDNVLWLPGTDHAGIATQNVVERRLAEEGADRNALGREKFIEKVWEWRREYGGAIIHQLKSMGASCDWDRERFTMDEGLSRAVRKVFVRLCEEGLIYKGSYITNWCPRCRTALADLEVEHEERDHFLYYITYPFSTGEGGITVATTRPETMLGDTAVAVNPEDERYAHMPAESVILPLLEREIPVIRDSYVDMEFGTGCLKITPAHDPNDFELGRKHQLPGIRVIDEDGRMTAEAGPYEGMDRFECRKTVLGDLEEKGLLVKTDPLRHSVGHCYRCHTLVEPNLSEQWFVKTAPLAEKAMAAVREGRTRIIPPSWESTYFNWLENIRDWCISRQIWWGHQIPAWTCEGCGRIIVAMDEPSACPDCRNTRLERETDVLDTWFSSALWPFSTMGWPDETETLKTFYPTSLLVTGFDILFFWVARMMMMGLHFMDEVPFRDVYVHALVRDEEGRKMSKSTGNVIDPLNVIKTYGTDAFRFTLAAFAAQGRDVKMSEKRVEGYRHFINKLWNAARFAFMHLDSACPELEPEVLGLPDRWILSRLSAAIVETGMALDEYRFNEAAGTAYQFVWHEFCDWYLEAAKPALYGNEGEEAAARTRAVLWRTLRDILVLLHPFAPFVTEEIWRKLPGTEGSIMTASWPGDDVSALVRRDEAAESRMAVVMAVITGIRNIRGEMNIAPSMALNAVVHAADESTRALLQDESPRIRDLARLESLAVSVPAGQPASAATAIVPGASVYVPLEGVLDFDKEMQRLEKEIAKVEKEMTSLSKKLNNESFLAKAPAGVVEENRRRHAAESEKHEKLESNLNMIRAMRGE